MADRSFLRWPIFGDEHRALASRLEPWVASEIEPIVHDDSDLDTTCRTLVRRLGDGGWLRYVVPAEHGGACDRLDVRSLCARYRGVAGLRPN